MSKHCREVVVITGASSGIGKATARLLAQNGAHVFVLGARRTEKLEAITSAIRSEGGLADYSLLDVTKRDQMEELINYVKTDLEKV